MEKTLRAAGAAGQSTANVHVPQYLKDTYWWAYLHPKGVHIFERQWLVNLILWGNYVRLRDSVLQELPAASQGRVLQVACVYGDFTQKLAGHLGSSTRVDVVDVAPVQIENLRRKLDGRANVAVFQQDSSALDAADGSYDNVILFFLLHEMPENVRARTVKEALRVVKPGGKVIFVDYHQPRRTNPFRYIMYPVLKFLEPFALSIWHKEIVDMLPPAIGPVTYDKRTFFGGLYQKVVITRK